MYKGIYIALSGGTAQQSHMDVITHNLANAQTVGYKKDKVAFQEFLLSQMSGVSEEKEGRVMSELSSVQTDYSEGTMIKTGNALDVAIEGKGFLCLEGGKFTRKGDLQVDGGYLVTKDGARVLGKGGSPLRIPEGKVDISSSGEVQVDGVAVGTLKIVEFPDLQTLTKEGEDLFVSPAEGTASKAAVRQGYLETSNVDVVREMIGLITALREFEAFQKAIHAFDDSTAKVTSEMGRI